MTEQYTRRVSSVESYFTWSPNMVVTVAARLRGAVDVETVQEAWDKVCLRHTNLRVRIQYDAQHDAWFTTEDAAQAPVQVRPRASDSDWVDVMNEIRCMPFDFDAGPAVHLVLLQSAACSDLVLVCHHVLCDGLSLAYVLRDLLIHMGDPTLEVSCLAAPTPIQASTLPKDAIPNGLLRAVIKRMIRKWRETRVDFDSTDYEEMTAAYWKRYTPSMQVVELGTDQTTELVRNCKAAGVTVNTALSAAIALAQQEVLGLKRIQKLGIAGSLRDRLSKPVEEEMGFYAGMAIFNPRLNASCDFWESARRLQGIAKKQLTNRGLMKNTAIWCYLKPSMMEGFTFKRMASIVGRDASRFEKLSAFVARNDVLKRVLKRDKMETIDCPTMDTGITNLTRLDFPVFYGEFELERMIFHPSSGPDVPLVAGIVTCAGRLSLVLENANGSMSEQQIVAIGDRALELLRGD